MAVENISFSYLIEGDPIDKGQKHLYIGLTYGDVALLVGVYFCVQRPT